MRTVVSHTNIVKLSVIREQRAVASSPFGPVRAGLITLQRTNAEAQLLELLSSLENTVESLNSKSYTASVILEDAIKGARAALSASINDTVGIDAS